MNAVAVSASDRVGFLSFKRYDRRSLQVPPSQEFRIHEAENEVGRACLHALRSTLQTLQDSATLQFQINPALLKIPELVMLESGHFETFG